MQVTLTKLWFIFFLATVASCRTTHRLSLPPAPSNAITGSSFYHQIDSLKWNTREPLALREILSGNIPPFLRKFVPVHTSITDSNGKTIKATYYVSPDYLSIGNEKDFARIPLTPITAQQIADSVHCFLPTRKMVNDIYAQAAVKLDPVPLFAYRDSAITFWHHHLIIEGQRQNRKGLIAGIKKDVVISSRIVKGYVGIYGWHRLNGKPIQPLFTKHYNTWVDYSHGVRLVYRKIKVNHHWMDYTAVLQHPVYRALLCDEEVCNFFRY